MYNIFLKKVHISIPKLESDPLLDESFERVNDKYFYGMIEKPNLSWGSLSHTKLGSYDYGTDMIKISQILKEDDNLLDYVMYHEILHKKLKFNDKNGKSYHHTSEFRRMEKEYEDKDAEKKLKALLRKQRFRAILGSW
jgi:predicted metal-dependent hydrolase